MIRKDKDEIEFKLSKSIQHHVAGDTAQCEKLILRAPSSKNRKYTTRLKQAFMRAVNSLEKKEDPSAAVNQEGVDEAKKSLTGSSICGLLLMSSIDLNDCYADLEALLLGNVAFIDKDKVMSKSHFDQLCDEDLELILGEYIANFLIPSWMSQAMRT